LQWTTHAIERFRTVTSLAALALCWATVSRAASPEIWLGPQELPSLGASAVDLMDMFTPDAPWKNAAAHTQVFILQGAFAARATQAQMNTVISDLSRRGIAIAVAVGVMNVPHDPPSGCGGLGNVEGYGTVQQAAKIAQSIKAAGGEIKYLVMDEPLYYGHYYTQAPGKGAGCHSSIQQIVQLIKPTLAVYTQAFPNLAVGEVEPTFFIDGQANWRSDFSSWADAYRAAIGRPLAFIHLDIEWPLRNGMQDALAVYNASQDLRGRGLLGRIGIIYNGSRQDKTDQSWTQAAREHVLLMEGQNKLRPDQAVFQSWTPNPTHALPESDPNALTSLVGAYLNRDLRSQVVGR
jgi:hypothetical protein